MWGSRGRDGRGEISARCARWMATTVVGLDTREPHTDGEKTRCSSFVRRGSRTDPAPPAEERSLAGLGGNVFFSILPFCRLASTRHTACLYKSEGGRAACHASLYSCAVGLHKVFFFFPLRPVAVLDSLSSVPITACNVNLSTCREADALPAFPESPASELSMHSCSAVVTMSLSFRRRHYPAPKIYGLPFALFSVAFYFQRVRAFSPVSANCVPWRICVLVSLL